MSGYRCVSLLMNLARESNLTADGVVEEGANTVHFTSPFQATPRQTLYDTRKCGK